MKSERHRLMSIAVHEAGHAVASFYLSTPLKYVTIVDDGTEGTHGHVRQRRVWFKKRAILDDSPRLRDRAERHILVSLAGQIALRRYAPRSRWQRGSKKDTVQAGELFWHISDFCYGDKMAERLYAALLWRRAEVLIENRWKDVVTVAHALVKRKRLTVDEVGDLIWPGRHKDVAAASAILARLSRRCK